jgi:hypothetical protein
MIVDALLALSGSITGNTVTGQAVFASSASVLSANTIDLGVTRDIGEGSDFVFGRFEVTTAFAGGTSAEFQIITADDAALTTNVKVLGTTGAIPIASLTAGTRLVCQINPVIGSKGQRYIGGRTVNVGANSAGSIYADVGAEIQDGQKFYASGFSIL